MPTPDTLGSAVGVVLAAGIGSRVGADGNKAYLRLAGRSMVAWSVQAVSATPGIDRTVLVYRKGERDIAESTVRHDLPDTPVEYVEGGDTRHDSESNVLDHLATDIDSGVIDVVLIHDAARPLATPDLMTAALATARTFGGAVPAVDAHGVLRADTNAALADNLVRVQTPQAFRAAPLLAAYRRAGVAGFDGTDTSSCVQHFTDVDVRVFPGAAANLKVTFRHDIALAEHLLSGTR